MMDVATLKADIAELKWEICLCKAEYVVTASETANKSELRRLILAKEQQLIPYFKMLQQATAHVIAVPTPVDVVNARFLNICLDPRLSYWSPAIPVNEKRHSVVSKQLKHAYTGCVMNRIICKLKGFTVPAKAAHIVANNSSINYAFFNYPKYADDLDPHCIRNYIPLCGTSGEADSCHNEFDQFLLTFIYNPMQQNFQIASLRPGWRHYDLNGASITFSHQPYRRLLAWRSRHS